jgi:iron complex outermembrane receptor protein
MSKLLRQMMMLALVFLIHSTATLHAKNTNLEMNTTVSGQVLDVDGDPLPGVNVVVKGTVVGTPTDMNGRFNLTVQLDPPITLQFSIVGFQSQELLVESNNVSDIRVVLEEQTIFGNDVVVSASRVEESILKSPVSIEKLDILDIKASGSPNFYDALSNLKGVDFSTQSLTFKSVNTRGFAANGNTRFVQLIDGIDNQAPGLNFAVGNIVGISELDLESAELLPGAASALYGPNAINGILLMNSKSPFDYQGLSVNIKSGVNHLESEIQDPSLYQSYSLRYAQAFNNKLAFKVNASYLKAMDFIAQDYRDQSDLLERGATSRADALNPRLYDGLNTYGDFTITTGAIADALIAGGGATGAQISALRTLFPDGLDGAFTPTGYTENSFVDNTTESLKLGAAVHYRLNTTNEILAQYNIGYGSTVYTANDRFVLDDFNIWTAKVELRNPNYYIRAYTTQEDAGDSYAANTLASLINQQTYLPAYFNTFAGARTQGYSVDQAHAAARAAADAAQLSPDSEEFKALATQLRNTPISEGGAKFLDKSDLYHLEGVYNFANLVDPEMAQIQAGVNVRRYALESGGTLFALKDISAGEEFSIDEWGAFAQASKQFLEDQLDVSVSARYDKNEYFDGQFSPRASAILTVADNHNIRVSYQEGFRIPTTQDQFIDLDVVSRRLVGSNPALIDRYQFESNPVYTGVAQARQALAAGASMDAAMSLVKKFEFDDFQPEKISTYEVGYKALFGNKLFVDAYYYFSNYTNFIAEVTFTQGVPAGLTNTPGAEYTGDSAPGSSEWVQSIITQQDPNDANTSFATQSYGFDINATGDVRSHGFAVTAEYSLFDGYSLGGNMAYNELLDQQDLLDQGFRASYNTPKWRYNVKLQNREVINNLGFSVNYRWQDAFVWESSIGEGVVDAFGSLDAQISYNLKKVNSTVKLGGTNILNDEYTTSLANPYMGAIYYISFTLDQLLK